jgi:hypothetical protein
VRRHAGISWLVLLADAGGISQLTMTVKKKSLGKRKKQSKPTSPLKGHQSNRFRTPERTKASTPFNSTPQVPRHTATTSTLAQRREAVIDDVGAADEIPLFKLLEAVLPIDSSQNVTAVWETVKSRANIVFGEIWTALQEPPSQQSAKENEVFKPLEKIFEAVVEAVGKARLSKTKLGVHGDKVPSSEWPNRTRTDASIHLKRTSLPDKRKKGIIDHADICCYMELKKENSASLRKDVSGFLSLPQR